jgi:hypothetical protein
MNQLAYIITTASPFEGLSNIGLLYSRTSCTPTIQTRCMRTVLKTSREDEIALRKSATVPVTSPIMAGTPSELSLSDHVWEMICLVKCCSSAVQMMLKRTTPNNGNGNNKHLTVLRRLSGKWGFLTSGVDSSERKETFTLVFGSWYCVEYSCLVLVQSSKPLTHWGRSHLNCLNARSRGF